MRKWFVFGFLAFMASLNSYAWNSRLNGDELCWALCTIGWVMLAFIELRRIQYHEDIGEE